MRTSSLQIGQEELLASHELIHTSQKQWLQVINEGFVNTSWQIEHIFFDSKLYTLLDNARELDTSLEGGALTRTRVEVEGIKEEEEEEG